MSEPKTLAVLVWGWWRHCDYHWSWLPSNKRFQAFGPSPGEPIKFKTSKALSICRSHLWKWNSYAHLPARWLIHWCSLPWFYQFLRSCLNGNLENIWRWLCWRTWLPPQINFELVDGMLRPCEALSFESFEGIPDFARADGQSPKD